MPKHNKLLGQAGEEFATQFLLKRGYTIIVRNWRTKIGEVDIIAKHNATLYFIEVKTRSNIAYGYPSEAITPKKLQRMKITASQYIAESHHRGECRLAVIEVLGVSCNLIEI
ncbi:MAG: YraN family protein [bacterium]|nr:YraN family protein [bacterium]